ncbi:MAG TPA: hypothetical protein VEX65_07490, partial [Flavisolibacter sp.]|nr:hypothetical protein [Flavisolibacter sp.]
CNRQAELVAYRNYRVVHPAGDGSAHTFRALPVSTMYKLPPSTGIIRVKDEVGPARTALPGAAHFAVSCRFPHRKRCSATSL